jgi:hypothetical protein
VTVIYLLSGTSWTVPADWSSINTIEVIGGGGAGTTPDAFAGGSSGGGGGGYAKSTNVAGLSGSIMVQIGAGGSSAGSTGTAGGDTWFNGASVGAATVSAQGGFPGNINNVGGAGGAGVNGGTTFTGGNGGTVPVARAQAVAVVRPVLMGTDLPVARGGATRAAVVVETEAGAPPRALLGKPTMAVKVGPPRMGPQEVRPALCPVAMAPPDPMVQAVAAEQRRVPLAAAPTAATASSGIPHTVPEAGAAPPLATRG